MSSSKRGAEQHFSHTGDEAADSKGNWRKFLDQPRPLNYSNYSLLRSRPLHNSFLATGRLNISLVCLAQVCASQAFESKGGTGSQRKLKLECAIFTFPFLLFLYS